jgi:hypothetical protein
MIAFKTLFKLLLVLVVPTMLALGAIDLQLRVPGNAHGIVSFEFCGWAGTCEATLAAWGEPGWQWAMLSLGLDYLFMAEYAGLVGLGLWMVAQRMAPQARLAVSEPTALPAHAAVLRRFAAAAVVAGVCDAAENLCLIGVVHSGQGGALAWWAALFAAVKFVLIGAALIALGVGWRQVKKREM